MSLSKNSIIFWKKLGGSLISLPVQERILKYTLLKNLLEEGIDKDNNWKWK